MLNTPKEEEKKLEHLKKIRNGEPSRKAKTFPV